jgi:hypothetical protein
LIPNSRISILNPFKALIEINIRKKRDRQDESIHAISIEAPEAEKQTNNIYGRLLKSTYK